MLQRILVIVAQQKAFNTSKTFKIKLFRVTEISVLRKKFAGKLYYDVMNSAQLKKQI